MRCCCCHRSPPEFQMFPSKLGPRSARSDQAEASRRLSRGGPNKIISFVFG
uniref:Uncharacterized protein n=1 Tax=Anguilla anguilla TaxID=7936 RepID=A0A0E9X030_ANGAN